MPGPSITNTSPFPAGQQYHAYDLTSPIFAGVTLNPPMTWDISGGALPPGLSINPNTDPTAQLVGTPTTQGVYVFTLRATDQVPASVTKSISLTIGPRLFPDPTINIGNIPYEHFDALPRPWADVTDTYQYQDGGMTFNRRTDMPLREWKLDFRGGLSAAQTAQFDTFWEEGGIDKPFNFTDKFGVTWLNVRVKSYSRSHQNHKWWERKVSFELVQYP